MNLHDVRKAIVKAINRLAKEHDIHLEIKVLGTEYRINDNEYRVELTFRKREYSITEVTPDVIVDE